jgi:hypothetical protein
MITILAQRVEVVGSWSFGDDEVYGMENIGMHYR